MVVTISESSKSGAMEVQHFSHEHPLLFIQDQNFASEEAAAAPCCLVCDKVVDGPSYGCNECNEYLHKGCAELELIPHLNHPFHTQHPLNLLPTSPYEGGGYACDLCGTSSSGCLYHCDPCGFDLHINCALLQSSIAANFPNSLHPHPLLFIPDHSEEVKYNCFACQESLSGPIYHCSDCSYESNFNLHKECAELPLEINHPFHPQHLLSLLPKSSSEGRYACNLCGMSCSGFVYRCDPCKFYLHTNCGLLQSSIAVDFPTALHQHPVFFVQNHTDQVIFDCSGCEEPLSGPIYHCSDCSDPLFNIHKKCAELPLEINHPFDPNHPLTLTPKRSTHPENCSCYLCKIEWVGFVYSCFLCKYEFTHEDVSSPQTITNATHEHPWTLLPRQMSFICDFCGTAGDRTAYTCATCDLLVHKNCIPLPRKISITRHQHALSHSYSLPQNQREDRTCKLCYEEVDTRYGGYYCYASGCNYIAHVLCATDNAVWDGKSIPEDYDERSMEAMHESSNLITDVFEKMSIGEEMVAIEIKHAFHGHNLRLTLSGEIKDDIQCDGCMKSISTPFYSCDHCEFFLHKNCAELPRKKRHPFHKHMLTLTNSDTNGFESLCHACKHLHHGFSYQCNSEDCDTRFYCDVRCILLSDTLEHPSHEHPLYLVHNIKGNCSGCLREFEIFDRIAYRCMKRCNFTLDIKCATLPLTVGYKYDKHPLTLAYLDGSSPCQHDCDLCKNERDPNHWFYYCDKCDNSLHPDCALGQIPFMKLGNEVILYNHPHVFSVVKNIWNCPPCKVCRDLCHGQALECKESECNFSIHMECRRSLSNLSLE